MKRFINQLFSKFVFIALLLGLATFYLANQNPTLAAQTASITVTPAAGSFTVGQSFTVDIVVSGGGSSFNAAQANVGVSSNLQVQSLTQGNCGFSYIPQTGPNTSNVTGGSLNFTGAAFSGSLTSCKVYTLTLIPLSSGAGGVSLSNGSVRSSTDSTEMMPADGSGLSSGVYTISDISSASPSPSLSPSPAVSSSPTPSASPSEQPTSPPDNGNSSGDLNGDGKINIFDLSIMLRQWNRSGSADLNHDGIVNIFDLSILLRTWTG